MKRIKLCFGIEIDAGEWGRSLGIKPMEAGTKNCDFCGKVNLKENNFCGNCGTSLELIEVPATPSEIVDYTIKVMGAPARPIELLPGKDSIYICQVLSDDEGDFVSFRKPLDKFPWLAIEKAIFDYVDLPEKTRPFLFGIADKGEKSQ